MFAGVPGNEGDAMERSTGLNQWVARLSQSELPVLKQTARDLTALRADDDRLSVDAIAAVIARDPMMTVKLLRYLQGHRHRMQTTEVLQIEQALLMLGIEPFFNNVAAQPLVEDLLKSHVDALPPVLRVVHRAQRASEYAMDWAVQLRDLHYEEIRIAALLHDFSEMLMWCFAPEVMLKIRTLQQNDKTLRSRDVQHQVLGFTLLELERELALQWGLPKLLLSLMNDASTHQQRELNVTLAINLARHSANGWDDAALPDDYRDIGELLRIPAADVMGMVIADAFMPANRTE
jgi:HD-like signal output (HDOD) protein